MKPLIFFCLLVSCVDICGSQTDCTGVACPDLQNCIDSTLEKGACCPKCTQRGCACEGYQFYDCVHAGFQKGKVPEGESYFVDFGSTECSCPQGGGKISCRFIPCPEIPANCIDVSQPADGCPQCARLGCSHGSRKYEAGHSFQVGQCQVCHCPNEGGKLMCSPVPDCDLGGVGKPTENNSGLRDVSSGPDTQQGTLAEQFSKLTLANTLPLYKQDPPSFGSEDYDYSLAEPTSSTAQTLARSAESTAAPPAHPETSSAAFISHDHWINELREQSPSTARHAEDKVIQNTYSATTGAHNDASMLTPTAATQRVDTGTHRPQQETGKKAARHNSHRNTKVGHVDPQRQSQGKRARNHSRSHSISHQEKVQVEPSIGNNEQSSDPPVHFSPTSTAPIKTEEDSEGPRRRPQTLLDSQPQEVKEDSEVSVRELVRSCCETGEKWASVKGHCNNMEPPAKDRHSVCWTAQQQCCLGSLKESQCSAGMNAARAGSVCEEDTDRKCGMNSYQECCGCCSLGLQFLKAGLRCEAHRHMGFHCQHVFLTCCGGEEEGRHVVRERPALDSTPPPRKVSDSPYPKEAFSIGAVGDGENAVEAPVEVEDMDECLIYADICHHRCVNTPGSYRCECFPGYVLQENAFTCAQEVVDEENKLREDDREETTSPLSAPHQPAVPFDPCEGNDICEQQCTPVAGRPHCSCSPGFSLRADGRSCEDINECIQGTHSCGAGFQCVNTEGSFRCNPKPSCPAGFRRGTQGNCVDIDECNASTQPCSAGFNCINTAGSFTCTRKIMCSRGYHASPDGSRCVDVNECETSLHRCGEGQLCQNLPGSYRCECRTGYQFDSMRRTCVDVNECWRFSGRLCAQTCENTPGSYQCSCTSGFRLSADGKSCEDVNECLTSPCSQECANIYGSYQCYCRKGYFLREDGLTCADFDECSQSIGHLCTYKCVNVPGSYQCACPEYGYTMSPSGLSCSDIDECATGAYNCSLTETCYNIQGGYRCLSLACPLNYRKVSDTRCERISCPAPLECQNSPVRITYYYLSFQSNIVVPAQIFRIGPSPAYSGDNVIVTITHGNEGAYFSTRKLNAYTGAVYLQRQVQAPRDFLVTVEMKLWRQGKFTTFQARIYVFITANLL
ncbi:fibulin-2 isoform X2 [Austrofundulus limnaeus]|uniref:Fibulin-2 isoform X2 n=1 Tax=Austrofundulus limnaeus TaxID=52670 RepID=A0A2I4CLR6_AUSLI|nr:PREDICTED: fibulin-2 isoform X2 [Austrofundulus limnaeus]